MEGGRDREEEGGVSGREGGRDEEDEGREEMRRRECGRDVGVSCLLDTFVPFIVAVVLLRV